MQIHFNGQPRELEPGTPVLELMDELSLDAQGIAVAINGEIIPAGQLAGRILAAGDRIEIIEAVGGG